MGTLAGGSEHYRGRRLLGGQGDAVAARPIEAELRARASRRVAGCTDGVIDVRYADAAGGGFEQVLTLCPSGGPAPPGLAAVWSTRDGAAPAGWSAPGRASTPGFDAGRPAPVWAPAGEATATREVWYRRSGDLWQVHPPGGELAATAGGALVADAHVVFAARSLTSARGNESLIDWQAAPGKLTALVGVGDLGVVATAAGALVAYAPTGRTAWSRPAPAVVTSLAAGSHRLFGTTVDGRLIAVDADTGVLAWQRAVNSDLPWAPVLAGHQVVVLDADGIPHAFAADSAVEAWRGDDAAVVTAVAGHPDGVLTATDRGALSSRDADGRPRWTVQLGPSPVEALAVRDNLAVAATPAGTRAYALDTGRPAWSGAGCDRLAAIDAGVVCQRGTEIRLVSARDGATLRRWSGPNGAFAGPVVETGSGLLVTFATASGAQIWRLR